MCHKLWTAREEAKEQNVILEKRRWSRQKKKAEVGSRCLVVWSMCKESPEGVFPAEQRKSKHRKWFRAQRQQNDVRLGSISNVTHIRLPITVLVQVSSARELHCGWRALNKGNWSGLVSLYPNLLSDNFQSESKDRKSLPPGKQAGGIFPHPNLHKDMEKSKEQK